MNRYPVWKYAIILIALVVGGLYALPNLFGESPAVQVSPIKATIKLDAVALARVEDAMTAPLPPLAPCPVCERAPRLKKWYGWLQLCCADGNQNVCHELVVSAKSQTTLFQRWNALARRKERADG